MTAAPQSRPRRVGPFAAALLALAFAALAAPLTLVPGWWPPDSFAAGAPAPVTVRAQGGALDLRGGQVVVARGQLLSTDGAELARRASQSAPRGPAALLGAGALLFAGALLAALALRRHGRGRLLRVQLAIGAAIAATAAIAAAALLLSPVSSLAMPVAAAAIWTAAALGPGAGAIAGLWGALAIGALSAFDPATLAVLAVQGAAPAALLAVRRPSRLRMLAAGALGGAAAALAYPLVHHLGAGELPLSELARPLHSPWAASLFAGVAGGAVAAALWPLFRRALGEASPRRLAALDDLSHPLLQELADKAPGTWQHSLTMAALGERAAEAIGADARLVRVGAYFHDLGKTLSPKHYLENLRPGEGSPHDKLAPRASAEALFAHVTEGVRLGRRARLPEAVVEMIASHHAGGLLEHFWRKGEGGAGALARADFCYPGPRPQRAEAAILAIVDAVEAASRGLHEADEADISRVVQRIVYGKLHAGQLDDAGLSTAELRRVSDALVRTLARAHSRAAEPGQPVESAAASLEVPLDALDAPRPAGRTPAARRLEAMPTEDAALAATEDALVTSGATRSLRPARPDIEILDDGEPLAAEDGPEQWDQALDTAASLAPPITAPPPPPRRKPSTIPLDDDAAARPGRADSDGGIGPGVLIIGAPPATHRRPGTDD